MGHDHDGAAFVLELVDAVEALALERLVADGQHLVDEQHVGVDVHRDRETEAHVHPRRVVLDLLVDEPFELGELDDVVEARLDVLALETEHRRVHVHVLAAGELGMEPGAELEQ